MSTKELLLQSYDNGNIYGISREAILFGNESYTSFVKDLEIEYDNMLCHCTNGDEFLINISFVENCYYSCDYFHHTSMLTDGTLSAIFSLIKENIYSIIGSMPKDFDMPTCKINEIEYVYGSPLITTEYGDFGTKDKPWLCERISCWTPVRFRFTCK